MCAGQDAVASITAGQSGRVRSYAGDMLPGNIDPVDEVAGRELERLASMHAEELMARMELRTRSPCWQKILDCLWHTGRGEGSWMPKERPERVLQEFHNPDSSLAEGVI